MARQPDVVRGRCPAGMPRSMKIAGAALKVASGTALYVAIIFISGLYPRAAGMMLTFPALNGLTLAFVARERLAATASIMFLIPVLNGLLCEFYIQTFRLIGAGRPSLPLVLFAAISAIWITVAAVLGLKHVGVPMTWRRPYVLLCAALLAIAMATAYFGETERLSAGLARVEALGFLHRNGPRIALFMATILAIVILADFKGSSARWLGPLGGFPLIAFFGVFTVADDTSKTIAERMEIMSHMAATAWFGPAVAVWFIYLFSRHLERRPPHDDRWDWARKVACAAGGWTACLIFIGGTTFLMDRFR
jgi:hypothetical protein